MGSIVGTDGETIIVVGIDGGFAWISRRKFTEFYDSILENASPGKGEFYGLFMGLLKYLSPYPDCVVVMDTAMVFARTEFIAATIHALEKGIRLDFIEEPCLCSEKYGMLRKSGLGEKGVKAIMSADYGMAFAMPLGKVIDNRLAEDRLRILSIGRTPSHTAERNRIVECLCRIHIDCGGYMMTDACISYIKDVMGIGKDLSQGTFRNYVVEATALCRERKWGKKELLPILRI